jgi:hypothetical protein
MTQDPFALSRYRLRRKVLKLFGAAFHVYDDSGAVVGFTSQAAFKLREDIRIYTDESKSAELLVIRARQVLDFSAAYDVFDPRAGEVVGTVRRKGWSSIVRDSWEVADGRGEVLAKLQEDSLGMALLRRFLSNLVPQSFDLTGAGEAARMSQRFNQFVYHLEVEIPTACTLDRRLVLATACLVAAIEGRQD